MINNSNQPIIIAHRVKQGLKRIPSIKNIIAVTSGKGGVGKSTTALNLALELAHQGLKIGILDADIYGPSLPLLIGATDYKPEVSPNNRFVPLEKFAIKAMSFGFLVDSNQATIWRGAIVNKALEQMLFDTEWGDLDILVIDMPPGTGDIHLTIGQKMPITATIVVTTPQDIALIDVGKSIAMFEKLAIPCLGVVENMALHICANCGHLEHTFGQGANEKLKQRYQLDLLAQLPLSSRICELSDAGNPLDLHPQLREIYTQLAIKTLGKLSQLPKDYATLIPNIQVVK